VEPASRKFLDKSHAPNGDVGRMKMRKSAARRGGEALKKQTSASLWVLTTGKMSSQELGDISMTNPRKHKILSGVERKKTKDRGGRGGGSGAAGREMHISAGRKINLCVSVREKSRSLYPKSHLHFCLGGKSAGIAGVSLYVGGGGEILGKRES